MVELVPLWASAHIMLRQSKIFHHKRLSDVVNVLKNVDNTSRPKLTKMKAYDLFSVLPAITPKHSFFCVLFLQGTNLACRILWRVRMEETKEAVDPLLLMGKWFTFRLESWYGEHMWPLSCCVRALLCEGDMIKHHLRLWYRPLLMSRPLQQLHETDYRPSLLYSDRLFSTYMGSA